MSDEVTASYGPFSVGLMALHDRAFFERLLANPRNAMTDFVKQGKLSLTDADMDQVVKLIESSLKGHSAADAQTMFDRYQVTGRWGNDQWTRGWPAY